MVFTFVNPELRWLAQENGVLKAILGDMENLRITGTLLS